MKEKLFKTEDEYDNMNVNEVNEDINLSDDDMNIV